MSTPKNCDRAKACDHCQTPVTLRYRIQHDASDRWVLVCIECWQHLSQHNPNYRYGGTWKAHRNKS
jgi:RNase P subunit RPR2